MSKARIYVARAQTQLEDLLLDKASWLALVGVAVAVAKWQGWDVPLEVFVAIEVLITAVILALNKKDGG